MISVANPATYSLLILGSVAGDICVAGFVFFRFDCGFEPTNAFTDPFAQLRELFGAEDKQGDTKNDQQMNGLKQSFKHGALLNLSPSAEFL
jgi:hypothetical protein